MLDQFWRGFIQIHILYHADEGPIYGAEISEELARHGYEISPGTLYPTLHRLEKSGYLVSERKLVDGRWHKYYDITPAGREALGQIRTKLRELVNEVLLGQSDNGGTGGT